MTTIREPASRLIRARRGLAGMSVPRGNLSLLRNEATPPPGQESRRRLLMKAGESLAHATDIAPLSCGKPALAVAKPLNISMSAAELEGLEDLQRRLSGQASRSDALRYVLRHLASTYRDREPPRRASPAGEPRVKNVSLRRDTDHEGLTDSLAWLDRHEPAAPVVIAGIFECLEHDEAQTARTMNAYLRGCLEAQRNSYRDLLAGHNRLLTDSLALSEIACGLLHMLAKAEAAGLDLGDLNQLDPPEPDQPDPSPWLRWPIANRYLDPCDRERILKKVSRHVPHYAGEVLRGFQGECDARPALNEPASRQCMEGQRKPESVASDGDSKSGAMFGAGGAA